MTLNFTQTDVPETVSTRTAEPNPFDDVFPTAEGKAVSLTQPHKTDAERKHVQRLIAAARRSAKSKGLSARVKMTEDKGGKVTLTFWTVAKITRTRKDAESK